MRNSSYIRGILFSFLCGLVSFCQAEKVNAATSVDLYQRVEEVMTNDTSFNNPFSGTELRLQVTAPPDRPLGSTFTWYGFYDGNGNGGQTGNVWKFRMLFDYSGTWTVKAGFYVPNTNTSNGPTQTYTYEVSNTKVFPNEHGHVRVDPQNTLRLRQDDGRPWVPFNIMSSMLLDRNTTDTKLWVDKHAELGVNSMATCFYSGVPMGYDSSQPGYWQYLAKDGSRVTGWYPGYDGFDYSRYDIVSWRHDEQIIEYAQSKGIKLSIWFGMSGLNPQYMSYGPHDYPNDTTLGPLQKQFIKYFLARWAPYTNWWHWTVDSEYQETGAGALERNRAFAAEMQAKNPWKTIVTTHVNSGGWDPGTSPEFDIATLQERVPDTDAGATDSRQFIYSNDQYNRPVYNSEGVWNLSNVTRARIATWTQLMAGGLSEIAHDSATDNHLHSSWGVNWNEVTYRHKEDAAAIGQMANFFNNTPGIDISKSTPHDELVTKSGGHLSLTLAEPGKSYYIWLDQGGNPTLDLSGQTGTYTVNRYKGTDLANPTTLATVSGGAPRTLGSTPTTGFGNDYLFVVKTTDSTCAESWTCTAWSDWSACIDGQQTRTRTCIDQNNCGTITNKPAESQTQSCNPDPNTKTFTNAQDTLISSSYTDYNYGSVDTYYIGARQASSKDRILIKFPDLISSTAIPQGSNITSATLVLTNTGIQNSTGSVSIDARRVLESWTEGNSSITTAQSGESTWSYRTYNTSRWASDTDNNGGDNAGCSSTQSHTTQDAATYTYTTTPADGQQISFDVTNIVKYWAANGEAKNNGFILMSPSKEGAATSSYIRFASSESTNTSYIPKLVVKLGGTDATSPAPPQGLRVVQ